MSGWNIALAAGLFAAVGARGRLQKPLLLAVAIAGVRGYTYLVGAVPSALRAAVMATLFLVAQWRGRLRETLTALVWETALLIMISPAIRLDPEFQLSFMATLALAVLVP